MTEAEPRAALRDRLAGMREAIVAEMIRTGFSAGAGALLAQIAAAADALAEAPGSPPAHESTEGLPSTGKSASALSAPAVRAVVSDDGGTMRLTICDDRGALGTVALDMREAVGLVIGLTDAISAHRRLAR